MTPVASSSSSTARPHLNPQLLTNSNTPCPLHHHPSPSTSSSTLNPLVALHPTTSSTSLHSSFPSLTPATDSKLKPKDSSSLSSSSNVSSGDLSRAGTSKVFELSDSDEELFLSGLDEQIRQVSAQPGPNFKPRSPTKQPDVIDLTVDTPPHPSRKRRFEHTEADNTLQHIKLPASRPSDKELILFQGRPFNKHVKIPAGWSFDKDDGLANTTADPSTQSSIKTPSTGPVLDLDEELSCPICCELFVAPVNFACGHAFCGSCAQEWLKKEAVCPTCRQDTPLPPARMYAMDAILQKYLQHQAEQLRHCGKLSEALALELEYQEKVDHWTAARKKLEAKPPQPVGRRFVAHINRSRPVTLPQIAGLGTRAYNIAHNRDFATPHGFERADGVPSMSQFFTGDYREREHAGWHPSRAYQLRPVYGQPTTTPQPDHRVASGSNPRSQPNAHFEAYSGWDPATLGQFFARS